MPDDGMAPGPGSDTAEDVAAEMASSGSPIDYELRGVSVLFLGSLFVQKLREKHGVLYGHFCTAGGGEFCKKAPSECPQKRKFAGPRYADASPRLAPRSCENRRAWLQHGAGEAVRR